MKENFIESQNKKQLYNEVIFEESAENFHTTDEFHKKRLQKNMNGLSNLGMEMKISKNSFSSEEKQPKYLDKNFQSAKELEDKNFQTAKELENKNLINQSIPTPIKQTVEKNTNKKTEIPLISCSTHQNEEPIIICFTCGNRPLCVECVVNGEHKNHDMANITRIKENCRDALTQITPEIERKQSEFNNIIERLVMNKKLISDKIWEIKSKISSDINELKERLSNKENELLMAKDCEASEKFAEIDGFISSFQEKIEKLQDFHRNLETKSEHSETFSEGIELLNYFTSNKQEIYNLFNVETSKFLEEVDDYRVDIDKQTYTNYLESLHNLNLATTNLNLNELDEKIKSSQKFYPPHSYAKINIEKSVVMTDQSKDRSPIIEESKFKLISGKMKDMHSIKFFDSPLKSGHITNTSFNISFLNDNTKLKNAKWMNKSLSKTRGDFRYINDVKENFSAKNYLRNYDSKITSTLKKTLKDKEKERYTSLTRALDKQKQTFLKKKEVFYC